MFGTPRGVELKTPAQIRLMRRAGLVVAEALAATSAAVRAGVTTDELNAVAADIIASAGATPSFLGYGAVRGAGGFPGVVCISVNDEVVHGIPGQRVLVDGDLVSIDCGAIVEGWHGDSALTVFVGQAAPEASELSAVTRAALWDGIAAARLGGHVGDISSAIDASVTAAGDDYGIVEEYVGHGIGSAMHQPPDVPNVAPRGIARTGRGPRLVEGLVLAVEPMITLGDPTNRLLDDDWTVVTDDGSLACHWEHTMTVTQHGVWVLTAADGGEEMLSSLGLPYGPLAD